MDFSLPIEIVTLAVILFQLAVYWLLFFKVERSSKGQNVEIDDQKPVSVLICARNEAASLQKHLPDILTQDYPQFEVLVVDDGSTDNTLHVLSSLKRQYAHLNILQLANNHVDRDLKGKKYALTKGIEKAKHNRLLLTDADCYPTSQKWIRSMAGKLNERHRIVIGCCNYQSKKGWLNRFIRFESLYVAMQYLSFALAGFPYMGLGRNLAYDKRLFQEKDVFQSHKEIASGDDDLVVQQLATSQNTTVSLAREGLMTSQPKHSLKDWLRQKLRHISTSTYYHPRVKTVLFLLGFSQLALYPLILFALLIGEMPGIIAFCTISLIITKYAVFLRPMKHFKSGDLWSNTLFYDFLLSVFYLNLGILHTYKGQKDRWQ